MTDPTTADLNAAIHAGHVLCDTCNTPISGYEIDYPFREVTTEKLPAWPGGPLIDVPLTDTHHEPTGQPPTLTVHPCGHHPHHLTYTTDTQ